MAHHCEATLITCEDFRLHLRADGRNYMAEFIKSLDIDCDLITRGGGIQDIVRPKNSGFIESLLRDLEVSVKLHQVKTIYLVNHTDCGAYASFNFTDAEAEYRQHIEDLYDAAKIIAKVYPQMMIKKFLFVLAPGKDDVFSIEEI
jgi:hypothetical protein